MTFLFAVSGLEIVGIFVIGFAIGVLVSQLMNSSKEKKLPRLQANELDTIQSKIDEKAQAIQSAIPSLNLVKANWQRLKEQLYNDQKQINIWSSRRDIALCENNDDRAIQAQKELYKSQARLEEDRKQFETQEILYKQSLGNVQKAQQTITEARDKAQRQGIRLQMANANAAVAEAAQVINPQAFNLGDISELTNVIEDQIHQEEAKVQVTVDLVTSKEQAWDDHMEEQYTDAAAREKIEELKRQRSG